MNNKVTAIYSDDDHNLTSKEQATRAEIREYDETGKCVRAVYGRFIDYVEPDDFDEYIRSLDEENTAK